MRIGWRDIQAGRGDDLHGTEVELEGWGLGLEAGAARTDYFALTDEPGCCISHLPRDPMRRVEIFAALPLALDRPSLRLKGRWHCLQDDADGWRYQLRAALPMRDPMEAAPHAGFTRRAVMAGGGALLGLSAWQPHKAQAATPAMDAAQLRQLLSGGVTVDIHSHGGSLIGYRRTEQRAPFSPLAEPMREGGMAVVCLTVVADTPVTILTDDKRIRPSRDPKPGELYAFSQKSFSRAHDLAKAQGLSIITSGSGLLATRADKPGVIIASEGADFLEGKIERLDEAFERWQLRHLQLTHYRPNELGDIQTEPPVHRGLTAFGADVVRRCNQLGIVVDVAHAPVGMVKQIAVLTTKPLVLSHTSMTVRPGPTSRQISPDHAKLIASTKGVIGIWPPSGIYADMAQLADGIYQVAYLVGADHVGLGSDMMGLVGASTFDSYLDLPALANALLARGFKAADVQKILGGNYARVFAATVGA